ncbi:peptidoglycan-binding protein, partial [Streptomyces umbrinus]
MRDGTDPAPGGRRRRMRILVPVGMTALLVTGTATTVLWNRDGGTARTQPEPSAQTATITRTDLNDSQTLDGILGYGTPTTVRASGGGTVTWLAPSGTTVARGHALYRVDDRPVPVLYGAIPLYRRLATPNTVGRDVRVLADNLRAMGYSVGSQPAPGQTVVMQPEVPEAGAPETEPDATEPAAEEPDAIKPTAEESGTENTGTEKTGTEEPAARSSPSATVLADRTTAAPTRVKVKPGEAVLTDALIEAATRPRAPASPFSPVTSRSAAWAATRRSAPRRA